jgi:hypothetical protein
VGGTESAPFVVMMTVAALVPSLIAFAIFFAVFQVRPRIL